MMTDDDFKELLNTDKSTIMTAVALKFVDNPVFKNVISQLIDDKLYTGAMLNPSIMTYGDNDKVALDVIVNAITAELIEYYSSVNPLTPGAKNVSVYIPTVQTVKDVNAAINMLVTALSAIPGGTEALNSAALATVGV